MNEFCKIFIVDDTQILARKAFHIVDGKPVPHVVFTTFFEENYILQTIPEVEFSGSECCPYHMNKRFDSIDQKFAEAMFKKMKKHNKIDVQKVVIDFNHN